MLQIRNYFEQDAIQSQVRISYTRKPTYYSSLGAPINVGNRVPLCSNRALLSLRYKIPHDAKESSNIHLHLYLKVIFTYFQSIRLWRIPLRCRTSFQLPATSIQPCHKPKVFATHTKRQLPTVLSNQNIFPTNHFNTIHIFSSAKYNVSC